MGTVIIHGLIIATALTAVLEMLMAAMWFPTFYRSGIPLFKRESKLPNDSSTKLDLSQLEAKNRSSLASSFSFAEIGHGEYAFREKLFEFRLFKYTPVMHGQIVIDKQAGIVRVVGRLYLFSILFPSCFWAMGAGSGEGGMALYVAGAFAIVVIAILYAIQAARFTEVAELVQNQLSADASDVAARQVRENP